MLELLLKLLFLWILCINFIAFLLMGVDKRRAKKGSWRVSEKALFLPVLLGGGIGGILGMKLFRHKTKHWYFVWGFPAILVAQIFLVIFLYCRL